MGLRRCVRRRRSPPRGLAQELRRGLRRKAEGRSTLHLDGRPDVVREVVSGPCYDPAAFSSYTMSGSLIGCLYTDTLAPQHRSRKASLTAESPPIPLGP
jgi:hypothetical protein